MPLPYKYGFFARTFFSVQDILVEISPLPSSSNTKFISLLHRGRESEILTSTSYNSELQRNMNESEEEKREGVEETHGITCAETFEEDWIQFRICEGWAHEN
ncbi:hypothetical protein AVEN_256947-1 [Araneus ventricosus]|uniref:Uncharacterized protein n=1 Tax=Araneus ventricosus TaxID=182803 RepID=A0A4Y2EDZ2_ARAVE|nr:hypothetical protein AVEN_256947-1 [Araneus ventricosus]